MPALEPQHWWVLGGFWVFYIETDRQTGRQTDRYAYIHIDI
jgi:hypothetical protein